MVLTFYDLRAAFLAVHALRGSRLREHPLTVRFSTSKDNLADKAVHQGELGGLGCSVAGGGTNQQADCGRCTCCNCCGTKPGADDGTG